MPIVNAARSSASALSWFETLPNVCFFKIEVMISSGFCCVKFLLVFSLAAGVI